MPSVAFEHRVATETPGHPLERKEEAPRPLPSGLAEETRGGRAPLGTSTQVVRSLLVLHNNYGTHNKFAQPAHARYTRLMDFELTPDGAVDFWPDLFRPDDTVSVRLTVHELGPEDGELTEDQRRAREYVEAETDRLAKMQAYTNPLDRAAMGLTFEQLKVFTAHYAVHSCVIKAAKAAGASVAAVKRRRKIDPVFGEMWDLARELWVDRLESRGMQRADLTIEDARDFGPSNDMLKFMLKTNSERHQDKINVRHEGSVDTRVDVDLTSLTDEERAELRALGRKVLQRGVA